MPEITNEPLLETPVNTPRQVYDAKTADAVQMKEINDIIHGVKNYGHEQCSEATKPSSLAPGAEVQPVDLPIADGVKQIEDESEARSHRQQEQQKAERAKPLPLAKRWI